MREIGLVFFVFVGITGSLYAESSTEAPPTAEVFLRRDLIEPVITSLDQSPQSFRMNGAWTAGRIGSTARAAIDSLIRRLSDHRRAVRVASAKALVRIGPDSVLRLRELLGHENPRTRRLAAWCLGSFGPKARLALPDLKRLYLDELEDPRVRRMAFRARERMFR